jgi:hypothetical protein
MSSRSMRAPDAGGWRARIGVLTPDDDTVPESEFWTTAPKGVSIATARVPLVDVRTYSDPPGSSWILLVPTTQLTCWRDCPYMKQGQQASDLQSGDEWRPFRFPTIA